jgi:hypothetical protein
MHASLLVATINSNETYLRVCGKEFVVAQHIPAMVMAKGGEEASASETIVVGDVPAAFGQGFG